MLGKKKHTQKAPNESIGKKKIAQDHDAHLAYSLTHHATKKHAYEDTAHKRSFDVKKKSQAEDDAEDKRREGFWQTLENDLDSFGEKLTEPLKQKKTKNVKKGEHIAITQGTQSRSPYVLRLGEQELRTHTAPTKKVAKESTDTAHSWLKEVERLRKETSTKYRSSIARVSINFVGKKGLTKRELRRLERGPVTLKKVITALVTFPQKALVATLRWLFEFALSIPLGFLLAIEVLLNIVEASHRGMVQMVRAINRVLVMMLEQTILGVISLIKGVIILPLKLVSLALLFTYRLVSSFGMLLARVATACYEFIASVGNTFVHATKERYVQMASIAIIALLIMVPVKFAADAPEQVRKLEGNVLGATKAGFGSLTAIQDSVGQGEVVAAAMQWEEAEEHFAEARNTIDSLNVVVRGLIKLSPQGKDGTNAIRAGEELAQSGALLTEALEPILVEGVGKGTITDNLATVTNGLTLAAPHIAAARAYIEDINIDHVPDSYQAQFAKARVLLPSVQSSLEEFLALAETLQTILGAHGEMRYAVLFQNNNELRPAGGFIGSLALVTIKDGAIVDMDIPGGGSYDFQGYLTEHVIAPKPLHLINPHWQLQDANWYPDWATSAEKVAWFLEKANVTSVDGVIAMQATTFVQLLDLLGPIEFPEYDVVLDSSNVLDEIQTAVEIDFDRTENKPKQYVAELAPKIIEKMLSAESTQLLDILGLIGTEVARKNVLMYFRDSEINNVFVQRGWQPTIVHTTSDYLSIVHANIGGGKTDGVIDEERDHIVHIAEDGTVSVELTIRRKHTGDPDHAFEHFNNVDYMRVYVPEGSTLAQFTGTKTPPASLFETPGEYYRPDAELVAIEGRPSIDESTGTRITHEFNKTAFGNWLQVDPGNMLVTKVTYTLPFKVKPYDLLNPDIRNSYSLIMQKQVGARGVPYRVSLEYPSHWNIAWDTSVGEGELQLLGPGLATFEGTLNSDTGFGVLFE